jgi:hypothetical protein
LLGAAPNKQNVFLEKIVEGTADFEEVFDKVLVEVCKANEALHFFEAVGDGPVDNGFNFDWIHGDSAITDN